MTSQDNHLWLEMWKHCQTGEFHQLKVNQYLARFWPRLGLIKGNRVFVPLCGKSLDMIWLANQGCHVIGVELSSIAIAAFFGENKLQPLERRVGEYTVWQHGNISIFCGDYFRLTKADLGHIDTVYDRAALTALSEAVRKRYVIHLHKLIDSTTNVFLLTIEDGVEPKALLVNSQIDDELVALYAEEFSIRLEFVESVLEKNGTSLQDDLVWNDYKVYRLMSKGK